MLSSMRIVVLAIVAVVGVFRLCAAEIPSPIVGSTGDLYISQSGMQPLRLADRDGYNEPSTISKLPKLTEMARFATVNIDGSLRTVVFDGKHPNLTLIVDVNRNGDLTDDPMLTMIPDDNGFHSDSIDVSGTPAKFITGGQAGERVFYHAYFERQGHLALENGPMLFVLHGYQGHFDENYDRVCFDLNRDGKLPSNIHASDECYSIEENVARIDGRVFEFTVDRSGSSLTLRPTPATAVQRVAIDPGNAAPDFSFVDLDGATRHLSDYHGQVVMLYAWATWCGPCREETPAIVKLYSKYKERGFEVVGLNRSDDRDAVRSYVEKHGITWPQSIQGDDGPILALYRIDPLPTTILVNREGTIVARGLRARDLFVRLESLLDDAANEGVCVEP